MLKFNSGIDIVQEIGQISTTEEALSLFRQRLNDEHFARIQNVKNPEAQIKIANALVMCRPEKVYINTGSEQDRRFIREMALSKGEESPLAMTNHTIHYDLKEEQGRIIDRTYYVANDDEPVSSLGLRMSRPDALDVVRNGMDGIMNGMTMVVGFYSRGPLGVYK